MSDLRESKERPVKFEEISIKPIYIKKMMGKSVKFEKMSVELI